MVLDCTICVNFIMFFIMYLGTRVRVRGLLKCPNMDVAGFPNRILLDYSYLRLWWPNTYGHIFCSLMIFSVHEIVYNVLCDCQNIPIR